MMIYCILFWGFFCFFYAELVDLAFDQLLLLLNSVPAILCGKGKHIDDSDTCSTASITSWNDFESIPDLNLKPCLRRSRRSSRHSIRFTTTSVCQYYPFDDSISSLSPEERMMKVDDWEFRRWQERIQRSDKRLPRKRFAPHDSVTKEGSKAKLKALSPRQLVQKRTGFQHRVKLYCKCQ